ncbi:MAG: radical SAM protein [Candidatus Obscuribacterales bacterium]|nr:radical SAM protein [Candidatus Obscuribacterales bacterium]
MSSPERPYIFYELTNSLCSKCLKKAEAKIIFQNENVYMLKNCLEHGHEKVLISTDIEYYKVCRNFLKAGQMPLRFNTKTEFGCPYDCGLCPDHEQHSCLTLLELGERCNLECPICYADSGPSKGGFRSLAEIEFMLDELVKNEGQPDVVQLSGGEPTIHPEFWKIMDLCKARPIKHLMINSNGIKIAQDKEFARRLSTYMPGFEVYLQFDSLKSEPLLQLRGVDLSETRRKAINHLNEFDVSTTLVVTLSKGLNDGEIGEIIDFALAQPCIRGVTFQPIQSAGRLEGFDPSKDRLTLGEVRQMILAQSSVFRPEDIIPVPCHPDCIAMAYVLKADGKTVPLSGLIGEDVLLNGGRNTIQYENDPAIKKRLFELFSLSQTPGSSSHAVGDLLCCLPRLEHPSNLSYKNIFRVIIMEFLDAYNFDVRSVKRSCVHIVHSDGRIIPFDTYNMFYRTGLDVAALSGRKTNA